MTIRKKFKVKIRRDIGLEVKPEAEQLDGNTYLFRFLWLMDDEDLYPGEEAWGAEDEAYPADAPAWLSSGDLQEA